MKVPTLARPAAAVRLRHLPQSSQVNEAACKQAPYSMVKFDLIGYSHNSGESNHQPVSAVVAPTTHCPGY